MSMPIRTLGKELKVSALGLGCYPMSGAYGGGRGEDAASEATISRALDLGITFLDTADIYGAGHNEMLVGRGIRGRRQEVQLATKVGFMTGLDGSDLGVSGKPDYIKRACAMSLRRLNVEVIDLYYLHRRDPQVPIEDSVGAMAELVEEGKVRCVGLSEVGVETLRKAHGVHPITALQSEYSLWTRGVEAEILAACRELGIGLVPFSPLGRGFLTGAVRQAEAIGAGDFRNNIPRFQKENLERNLKLADRLAELAKRRGCSASQLALAWLLAQGDDIVPIPGTRSTKHMEENAGAAAIVLTAEEAAEIAAAIPPEAVAGERYTAALQRHVGR